MDVTQIIRSIYGAGKQIPPQSIKLNQWLSWYRGNVMGFHNYRIYNGSEYVEAERKTMGLAKQLCETWANLLMNERCDIILPDDAKEKLDVIFNETNFWLKANDGIEKAFALGIGALVVNVKNIQQGEKSGRIDKSKARVSIDYVNALKVYPITIEDKEVTECAFVSRNSDTTNIVVHQLDGTYKIHNYVLGTGDEIIDSYVFDTGSDLKWFYILRPNISSNYITQGMDTEIGISVFANAIDNLKSIDNKYDGFDLEFVLGRKKIYISTEAWKVSMKDGKMVKTFDPYDTLYYHLPENADGKPIITSSSDTIRWDAYINAINVELDYLSSKCGLGENYFKFDGSALATATQVISENSTLYRTIKKHEILLENVLRGITRTVIYAANTFTNNPIGEVDDDEIKIKFDDSIIEDRESEMRRDREDMNSGVLSKVEYRMKWYAEDEDTAKKKVADYFLYDMIGKYSPALATGAITPEQFVEKVYPDAPNKEEIIAYIESFAKSASMLDMEALYAGDESGIDDEEESETN
jgi:hypothetical protein